MADWGGGTSAGCAACPDEMSKRLLSSVHVTNGKDEVLLEPQQAVMPHHTPRKLLLISAVMEQTDDVPGKT